jgi:hypothetical protein
MDDTERITRHLARDPFRTIGDVESYDWMRLAPDLSDILSHEMTMSRERVVRALGALATDGKLRLLMKGNRLIAACLWSSSRELDLLAAELHPLIRNPATINVNLARLNEAVSRLLSPTWFDRAPVSAIDALMDGNWAVNRLLAFQVLMALRELKAVAVWDSFTPGCYSVIRTELLTPDKVLAASR